MLCAEGTAGSTGRHSPEQDQEAGHESLEVIMSVVVCVGVVAQVSKHLEGDGNVPRSLSRWNICHYITCIPIMAYMKKSIAIRRMT